MKKKLEKFARIETAIKHAKLMLIAKCKKSGLYENFGQNEVRLIKGLFIDISDYSDEMNAKRDKLDAFNEWCMTYSG